MTNETTKPATPSPVKTFRDRAINISVWENHYTNPDTGESKVYHSLYLQRAYKQGDTWKHTPRINVSDALRVASLYREAHRWYQSQKQSHVDQQPPEPV